MLFINVQAAYSMKNMEQINSYMNTMNDIIGVLNCLFLLLIVSVVVIFMLFLITPSNYYVRLETLSNAPIQYRLMASVLACFACSPLILLLNVPSMMYDDFKIVMPQYTNKFIFLMIIYLVVIGFCIYTGFKTIFGLITNSANSEVFMWFIINTIMNILLGIIYMAWLISIHRKYYDQYETPLLSYIWNIIISALYNILLVIYELLRPRYS